MSQKKMEAYKNAKKNKKQIEKKQKRNRILAWIAGILITAALIAGSAFLVYYTQHHAGTTSTGSSEGTAEDVANLLQESLGDDSNFTVTTEPMEETETEVPEEAQITE